MEDSIPKKDILNYASETFAKTILEEGGKLLKESDLLRGDPYLLYGDQVQQIRDEVGESCHDHEQKVLQYTQEE